MANEIKRSALLLVTICILKVNGMSVPGCGDYSCPVDCETCTSDGTCCTCIPGKYGSSCSQDCHIYCLTCSSSGICETCKISSLYGPLCDKPCEYCKGGACNRYRCLKGCKDGFFETQLMYIPGEPDFYECVKCPQACTTCTPDLDCTGCIARRWGGNCETQCPRNCDMCDQRTGECVKTECGTGQYLEIDETCKNCPDKCSSCTSATDCTGCVGERQGKTCDSVTCSRINHCQECTCSSDACTDIKCIHCEDGYSGDKCNCDSERNVTNNVKDTLPKKIKTVDDGSTGVAWDYDFPKRREGTAYIVGLILHVAVTVVFCVIVPLIYVVADLRQKY